MCVLVEILRLRGFFDYRYIAELGGSYLCMYFYKPILMAVNNDKGVHSVGYLMQFYKWKLEYLDSIWLKINIPTLRGGVKYRKF